jgi:hypothetical protein
MCSSIRKTLRTEIAAPILVVSQPEEKGSRFHFAVSVSFRRAARYASRAFWECGFGGTSLCFAFLP